MVSLKTLFRTGVPSLYLGFGRSFVSSLVLPSAYHLAIILSPTGQTERLNQELETCLRCLVAQNQTTWSDHLTWVEYAHNSLPTAATGLSPFQVVHGYQPPLFPSNEEEVTFPSAHALARRCRKIWAAARRMLLRGQARMKVAADRHRRPAPTYSPGQKVWLSTKDLPLHVPSVHPTFHVSKIKPVRESHLVPPSKPPPPPKMVEGGPVYAVKKLLAVRKSGRGRQFLVEWDGYGPEERSWIPASFIVSKKLIEEFYRQHPDTPGPSGVGPKGKGEKNKDRYVARIGVTGAPVFAHGTRPGSARNSDVGPPSSRLTTRRKVHEGPVQCGLGSSRGGGPRRPNPWTKTLLAIGTWNVTSLGGKEPELVREEVERYRLEIVGLTSTHSLGSGTQLLERGWTLHYSGVAQGERRRAGVGLLIAPQLSRHVLEFTPVNERVASLRLSGRG
ncbi:hypothetical protein L3Q82_000211 [Scortum barcoo]|uniref:Uncharacterized protein n=1 Tax=Scortum barcoo TaxID=214431 RepID=A0ACB8XB57_9TELE|nr:hypothetical protein L3Q82_000211 [Scortum barcoo]